jgi:hypothetical protein
MKKRTMMIIIFLIILLSFTGCQIKATDLPINHKKPNNYYYTNLLIHNVNQDSSPNISILETNLHKEKVLPKEDMDSLMGFFKSIKTENFFNEKPSDLPQKPVYKIFVTANKEKYVLDVYNEKYVAVYPWDGVYSTDYIDMSSLSNLYNLNGLCKYILK